MSKHTPEPWNIYFNSQDDFVIRKMFADGQESHVVARCHSGAANARRIVACVNACEGFSIEELQGANLFKDSIESDAEIMALKKQRNELLKALEGMLVWFNYHTIPWINTDEADAIAKARAAVAKSEGES